MPLLSALFFILKCDENNANRDTDISDVEYRERSNIYPVSDAAEDETVIEIAECARIQQDK